MYCAAIRFGYRLIRYVGANRRICKPGEDKKRVLIVGVGQVAKELINDLRLGGHENYQIFAIADENPDDGPEVSGHYFHGSPFRQCPGLERIGDSSV